jgi:hypothetical protein
LVGVLRSTSVLDSIMISRRIRPTHIAREVHLTSCGAALPYAASRIFMRITEM